MTERSDQPLVDIVIPVHSTTRPLGRAVASALRASTGAAPGQCRVTVVAHHLTAAQVSGMLSETQRALVQVVECEDRGVTAAVPRNEALRRTTARYVSFLDSDDTLDPGAVTRWLGIAERRGSDLVIPFQHHENGRSDITPVVRPWRAAVLDAAKDRLPYRSTAFGLVRVATARAVGAGFHESVRTGEDQSFVMALYSGAHRLDYAPGYPGLLMHADAQDRVSGQPLPVGDVAAATLDLLRSGWFPGTPEDLKTAYVLKFLRVNFFPALEQALIAGAWDREWQCAARSTYQELSGCTPAIRDLLSRADARVVELLLGGGEAPQLLDALAARRRFGTTAAVLTPRLTRLLGRHAPLRTMAASSVQLLRYRLAERRCAGQRERASFSGDRRGALSGESAAPNPTMR